MKNYILITWIIISMIFNACNTQNKNPSSDSILLKENELLKRELNIKQEELNLEKEAAKKLTHTEPDIPVSELYKRVKQGVFLVYVLGNNTDAIGSGFFLDKKGVAISNYHVFENAQKGIVILDNGEKEMITKIIYTNKELDYVIFKVGLGDDEKYFPLNISNRLPDIGESCFAIGNPKGLSQTLSIGNISGYRNNNNQHYIQTTAEITHGSSGGPLFDKHGDVIGITTMGLDEANLNFAIELNAIPYSSYLNESNNETITNKNVSFDQVKTIIAAYYECLSKKNYNRLASFYAPTLERYYTYFNLPQQKAIINASEYFDKYKIIQANVLINWQTFRVENLNDGNIMVTFNMDYILQRIQANKPTRFNLDINILMMPDLKIKSIFENIISKA
ncbi:S1C family serine protease [Chitinophaga silvisoli]|uniref:Serine protease n=1 Tax=Chitinophaga silvisoli TaxID=2291814 RepID=A0A3E1P4G2_9BACT|nr:S1C family serine protease [Chitinophaga silvisoli]RFM35047.1 serine protease [Chitinophaga silvisoli]